jgi:RimJ/RimL family protein N-acetyltransferase
LPYSIRIAGDQVVPREFTTANVDDVLTIVGDDKVTACSSFDSRDRGQAVAMIEGTLERARQEPRVEFYFAVAKACDEARVIGFARIGLAGVKAGKLGYAIAAGERGPGYATDAHLVRVR